MNENKDPFGKPPLELKYYILMETHGREYLEDLFVEYREIERYEDCAAITKVLVEY